ALMLLATTDFAYLSYRYVIVAGTWAARSPAAFDAFVARHVPPGSAVVGPDAPFFFSVERAGSRFRSIAARSWADWARWVPLVEPAALGVPRRFQEPAPFKRFLLWPSARGVPGGYACALPHLVARFEPAPPEGW